MNNRLNELFHKYLDGRFTAAERLELLRLLKAEQHEANVKDFIEKESGKLLFNHSLSNDDAARVFQSILDTPAVTEKPETRHISWLKSPWLRIAAAIVLLAGAIGYFIVKSPVKNGGTIVKESTQPREILPGTDKAILTLADGKQIVLDNTAKGNITQQGNINIIKLDNGSVTYRGENNTGELTYNTISTPRGGQYQIILSDGSRVWLNAASSIRFPAAFVHNHRTVSITGEAYLEVAKNKEKPFLVEVKDMTVQVLGTEFNINAYQDENETHTTLIEGGIRIVKGEKNILPKPGQQVLSTPGSNNLQLIPDVDIKQVTAWKTGIFNFNKQPLKNVMLQLSRWYDVEIEYEGNVPPVVFYGEIRRDLTLQQVLQLLKVFELKFEIKDGRRLIVSKI